MKGRLAANPIPYWASAGKTREVFDQAFADFAAIGYTAVKADVPDNMAAAEYRDWIGGYGLAPALSLFSSPFDETVDIVDEIERAKQFAATQVELGLDRTMISSMAAGSATTFGNSAVSVITRSIRRPSSSRSRSCNWAMKIDSSIGCGRRI